MPSKEQKETQLCVDDLRHAEYYSMQEVFDDLYARSKNGEVFTGLMDIVLSRENILLAYRNIKTNKGSKTPGVDGLTIKDIGRLTPEEVVKRVRYIVAGRKAGYIPKPVRRKDIPKPYDPTKTRPLGIPCIWDRLVQQCIKQVLEPICEARFSDNSYGFRPERSTEHAIAATYRLLNQSHLHYVIEFDIKGFFDNVDHTKLMRQMWAMGIRDTHLLSKIQRILKTPIKMPDGHLEYPTKGTPQGGIISPLLANIVLNELDKWVESQWQDNPVAKKYSIDIHSNGSENLGNGYKAMKKTKLKEMRIVRYADDFRIFCRTKTDAEKTKIAVTQWLFERLKLEVSPEKTRVVNVKRKYSEFLGIKIILRKKGDKYVTQSHMTDKNLKAKTQALTAQAKLIARPPKGSTELEQVRKYNSMVMGIQNYFQIATLVSQDCSLMNRRVMTVLTNRLRSQKGNRLVKTGRPLTKSEKARYGKSAMLRYVAGTDEPIYPIGYIQCRNPMNKKRSICRYTPQGRIGLHDNLRINVQLLHALERQPLYDRSVEYADNRVSLFSAQWGKCAVTGEPFLTTEEIHCHHIVPRSEGGTDKYENLVLVSQPVHRLIHATDEETIQRYMTICNLNPEQLMKLNELRKKAERKEIC